MTEITFAIADVHGAYDKLVETIEACRRYAAGRDTTFILLGDYVDRGPDSARVIALLRNWRGPERLICLMGNHEDMLLLAIKYPESASAAWLGNGGKNTLWSYGVLHAHQLPQADLEWMEQLPKSYDDGLRLYVHAGIDPSRPLNDQSEAVLMYTKKGYPDDFDPGRYIVHGHTMLGTAIPAVHPHRINLDTGACMGRPLSAAAFLPHRREPVALIVGGEVIELGTSLSRRLEP